MPFSKELQQKLEKLSRRYEVFNSCTRYSKYRIHRILEKRFMEHLPTTKGYGRQRLRDMMKSFKSLYIKPQSSSIGKGIIKIARQSDRLWKIQLPHKTKVMTQSRTEKTVDQYVKSKDYIIQEAIPLADYQGKPYDVRVSVQRGADGQWQMTGMYGKVARKGSHVTNVARRGTVKKCSVLFSHSFQNPGQVAAEVQRVSLQMTQYLGEQLKNLADVGLDIGVDRSGKPYFIEMNGRDQRYGFKKAKMKKTFYRTYENPILYAKYIQQSSGTQHGGNLGRLNGMRKRKTVWPNLDRRSRLKTQLGSYKNRMVSSSQFSTTRFSVIKNERKR
nr:YheC/YheD family protein [Paenibacillus turpanensis]